MCCALFVIRWGPSSGDSAANRWALSYLSQNAYFFLHVTTHAFALNFILRVYIFGIFSKRNQLADLLLLIAIIMMVNIILL